MLINFYIIIIYGFLTIAEAREAVFEIFDGKIYMDKFLLNCANAQKYPTYYENITVSGNSGHLRIDYTLINKVLITPPLTLAVEIQRCRSRENPDSCIKFANFKTSRLCNLLESTKEFWSPIVTCATPKIACPVSKGIYKGRDCTLDMSSFNWFPLGESYWKLRVTISITSGVIGCSVVEGKFMKSKKP